MKSKYYSIFNVMGLKEFEILDWCEDEQLYISNLNKKLAFPKSTIEINPQYFKPVPEPPTPVKQQVYVGKTIEVNSIFYLVEDVYNTLKKDFTLGGCFLKCKTIDEHPKETTIPFTDTIKIVNVGYYISSFGTVRRIGDNNNKNKLLIKQLKRIGNFYSDFISAKKKADKLKTFFKK